MIQEGHIQTLGGNVFYKIHQAQNNTSQPPLVIIHGGPGIPHQYLSNLSALSQDRPVIFYDQLGCGKSAIKNHDKSLWCGNLALPRFVTELEDLINFLSQKLSVQQFDLLGHSWGGSLAIEYALAHPEKIRKLILASPLISTPLWIENAKKLINTLPEEAQQAIQTHELAGTTDSPEYQAAKNLFDTQYLCRITPFPELLMSSCSQFNFDVYQNMWGPSEFTVTGNLKNFDRWSDLSKINLPTLITCGRFDEASPELLTQAQKLIKNSELTIFENSAHMPHLEEPENYLKAIQDFLNL